MNTFDGRYFLHPDGCGWTCAEIRDGKLASFCEESEYETHLKARDRWAGIKPSESDELVGGILGLAVADILRVDPEQVTITRHSPQ